jgi:hypothetical protein
MASNSYAHFQNSDTSSLGQTPCEPFSDELSFDPDAFYAFAQAQPGDIAYEYSALRDWDTTLQVPYQYGETSTPSDPSSDSTPLPLSDLSGSDNDPSCKITSESKRKLEILDQTLPNKRPKSAEGHAHSTHTAMNRKKGACLSCQMRTNKHGCRPGPDPTGPCQACWKKGNALGTLICWRARFQDVKIIRLGPSRDFANTLRWLKDLKPPQDPQKAEWKKLTNLSVKKPRQSQGYIELRLSQGHSRSTLNLRVQEFDPVKGDKTNYPWFDDDGVGHIYQCPHYAIADRDHATDQVRRFIDSNVEQYVYKLLPATTDPSATFVRMVFQNALKRAHESSLIALTIKFWVAGRLIEDPWSIQGSEALGMRLDPLPASPYSQRIPVTPIMDFQIDNIVIYDYLMDMLDRIRKAMKERIMPRKKEDWFDIHLATFILLHHVDLTMRHDIDFAISHNLPKRFSNQPLIEMITFGANSLLKFHQHEKGHFPLSAPNWAEVETGYRFNESQKSYLLKARGLIQQIDVPRKAGDDLFWTSQIYDSTWQPALVKVI